MCGDCVYQECTTDEVCVFAEGAALGVALLRRMVAGGVGGGALTVATTHHSIMTGLKVWSVDMSTAVQIIYPNLHAAHCMPLG